MRWQEHLNTQISGRAVSGGEGMKDARVEMKPFVGGRSRVAKSKTDGGYEIKSLKPGDYVVSASGKGTIVEEVSQRSLACLQG